MSLELLNLAVFPVQIAHSHIAVKFSESKNSSLLFSALKKARKFFFIFFVASIATKIL